MKKLAPFLILLMVLVAGLTASGYAWATCSEGFHTVGNDVFDDWEISRTRAAGSDGFYQISEKGFRPVIVYESLGEEADIAYHLGEQMAEKYPDLEQRAEKIFYYVRDRVRYTPDKDQFKHDEFAQNADELADKIAQNGVGHGDCEDSAILLAVMYKGAGYRSAIAVAPGHTAAMVYLPEYKRGSIFKMNGEEGWVWAEATGRNNPLGWVDKDLIAEDLFAYEIKDERVTRVAPTEAPATIVTSGGGGSASFPVPFFSIIILLWFITRLFRRRAR
ncbi:MAG: transglutaminase domain-containing protein [Chloroflexota bacterium]|nr:transglutaminase-like domain-containing protein [Chloroflexota bacterium]